jgi:hypothetical protein
VGEITVERRHGALAHRGDALLAALAAHAQQARAAVEIALQQSDEFREPQA